MGHPIHKFIMDNPIMRYILIVVIIIWMFPIMKPAFIFLRRAKKEIEKLF